MTARSIEFDWRISLGNLIAALVFLGGIIVWYANVGSDISQIKEKLARIDPIEARTVANEKAIAVNDMQAKWIMDSLKRLQDNQGIYSPPPPKGAP